MASFFVGRIDAWIDPKLKGLARASGPQAGLAKTLLGKVAIASAKMAYQIDGELFGGERFRKLAEKGARNQRLLWASTNTRNPEDNDLRYVEALIGPNTVNTLTLQTLEAYRGHGNPAPRLMQGLEEAHQVLDDLAKLGFDLDEFAQQLEDEGIARFKQAYEKLITSLDARRETFQANHRLAG